MMERWLKKTASNMAANGVTSFLCRSGQQEFEDLLFFELGERTCFIQIDIYKPGRFEFGDVEDHGKLSLGVYSSGYCTEAGLKSSIDKSLEYDKCERELFGRLIQNGRSISVEEIQREWLQRDESGGIFLKYQK